jgi:hypothetical protein
MRRLLAMLGWRIVYACEWGEYDFRYDSIDVAMSRPIHPGMSVAPPWARMKIAARTRTEGEK